MYQHFYIFHSLKSEQDKSFAYLCKGVEKPENATTQKVIHLTTNRGSLVFEVIASGDLDTLMRFVSQETNGIVETVDTSSDSYFNIELIDNPIYSKGE